MTWEALRETFNPEGSSLRRAQIRMVEMLQFLDRVCKQNGIRYWLDSGNLIGAARNGQFIPWDDDMDVCMLRADALKFKRLMLGGEVSDEFVLQCHRTDPGYFGCWMALRDLKSEYLQDSNLHKKLKYRGLQIDIFVYEERGIPLFFRFAAFWQQYCIFKPLRRIENATLAKCLAAPAYFFLHKMLVPLMRLVSPAGELLFPYYGTGFKNRKKQNVFPLSEIDFEGLRVPAPCRTDAYLTDIYGDWRRLPERIQTHDVEVVFIEDGIA